MRAQGAPARLLAIALVFILLGTAQWIWSDTKSIGQGLAMGGALVAVVAVLLLLRDRRSADL